MIAILLIAVALIAIALILLWGLRSIHAWQAEIAGALRALAYSSESAEQREERLLRLAERDLMAPQKKTGEELRQEAELRAQYESSLPREGKAALKASRLQASRPVKESDPYEI